jgi:hypothetical protein
MATETGLTFGAVENPTARGIGTGDQVGNSIVKEVVVLWLPQPVILYVQI